MKTTRFNIASFIFVAAIVIATVLVVILLRNPATHHNLEDPGFYTRTELAFLGQEYLYSGYGRADDMVRAGMDPHEIGRSLYVRAGCVGCHGIYAEGATVAGGLWDLGDEEPSDVVRDVRDGPLGMPAYPHEVLTDGDVDFILAFIAGAQTEAASVGVTTTTTTRPPVVTTTAPPTTTTAGPGATTTTAPPVQRRTVAAPRVEGIVVDGDPSDWADIPSLAMTLVATVGESAPDRDATVQVAHDGEFIYVLFTVEDDFNWSDLDPRFAGAPAVMWPIEATAGPHMGGDDPTGYPALGMVDIWYWRLECPIGVESGGAVAQEQSGDPGNDATCNLDDEYATEPEVVDDDDAAASDNSLLGVFGHSNPTDDAEGTWYFEFRRPMQTGDPLDTQFAPGTTARLALAYWDPDAGQAGWGRRDHVQSSDEGWIDVLLGE